MLRPPLPPLSRRRFLATSAAALGAAALGDAFLREPTAIAVTRHEVPVPGLAPDLDGLRVALVSDVHLHDGVSPAARAALHRLAEEQADVVVLVGDICNEWSDLSDLAAWARDARGTLATFATLGNWEHYANIDQYTAARTYGRAGVELLFNSTARVARGDGRITFLGLDDPVEGHPDLLAALSGVPTGEPCVWLVHAPGYVDRIPRDRVPAPSAVLAGHTHGGQIRLPFFTPYLPYGSGRFVEGWYHDTVGPLYVSRGIGTIVVRARLFCPPELPVFTLRRALPQGAAPGVRLDSARPPSRH